MTQRTVTLDARSIEAIAQRVSALVSASLFEMFVAEHGAVPTRNLVDAKTVAEALGVDRSYVYAHADELGAIRLGGGSKPRLRFDLETAREAFACYASKQSQGSNASAGAESAVPAARRRRRLPNRLPEPGSVLAVRSRGASSSGGEAP